MYPKMEPGRRELLEGKKLRKEIKQGGAREKARCEDPKGLMKRQNRQGLSGAKGTVHILGGSSYGPEGQQGCQPYLAKEDADLVPIGIASQRSDAPHIRDQLGQVLAAAVHFCFPV